MDVIRLLRNTKGELSIDYIIVMVLLLVLLVVLLIYSGTLRQSISDLLSKFMEFFFRS